MLKVRRLEAKMKDKNNSIVIFSKDRAAQLDLCLNSIFQNLKSILEKSRVYIIYASSSKDFETAYTKLSEKWNKQPSVYFLPEKKYGGFKKTLEYSIKHWDDYVLFFTDDDIVYRNFENDFDEVDDFFYSNKDLFCLSLRLGANTFIQDQYRNTICKIPDEILCNDECRIKKWSWTEQAKDTNFAYPFSVDGHLFCSTLAKSIIDNTENYYNPNSLEGGAQHYMQKSIASLPKSMACFEKSFVVNTPLNRVQETCTNIAGKFFANEQETLNKNFLSGNRLCLNQMDFDTIIGAHQELKLFWKDKNVK